MKKMNVKMREIQSIHFDQIKYRDFKRLKRELGSKTESNKQKLLKDASFIAQGNLFFLDLHRL